MEEEGRSLIKTPTWAVATVISFMVIIVFLFTGCVELFAKWLDGKRKRRPLSVALEKIKDELMVFGVMSLLLGHWRIYVAMICVKADISGSRVHTCIPDAHTVSHEGNQHINISSYIKEAVTKDQSHGHHSYCDEGYESFASYESLEQLHRLLFVLGITHVIYSSAAIALAVTKIYSWRAWENEAKSVAMETASDESPARRKLKRMHTFILKHASHPWSERKTLVWLLCFSRQFWSSINKSDYTSLRFGFILTHQLPLSYDFLNYLIRSMHEDFCDIVGISIPLWIYAVFSVYLDFHGSYAYFWLSFLPAVIIILIGTKLHHIVVKLAVETVNSSSQMKNHVFHLRDELFWLQKPKLLLRLIQFISLQNSLEMAMFLWSLWEISGTSCFMKNPTFVVIRLSFGVISQVCCSFITFPLYVLITQMGSRFKRTVVSEGVMKSLYGWKKRVKGGQNKSSIARLHSVSSMPLIHNKAENISWSSGRNSSSSISRSNSLIEDGSRWSAIEYRYAGEYFSSNRSSFQYEGDEDEYDSYSSSDYDEYEDENERTGSRYYHLA